MSSPPSFTFSSPTSSATRRRRKSAFTSHVDLDAFYAQCEMVRLSVPPDQPLAVQQWQGLIAINYPARKFGLNRHVTITEAKKLCPELICQHVATWREGDAKWAYHEDSFKEMATHKVSLDPYRLESRRILALIKEVLPAAPVQRVEKASIDEVFLDLSAQVYQTLLERYPVLKGPAPYDDPTEHLPRPPTTALDWAADALVDLDKEETEEDEPDWDDVAMLIGSEIVRNVRTAIFEKLKYTCSAGISRNKMLAKLGSAHKKPNSQTVIRNRAVQQFLSGFKFTKIRNLGGKLGDEVVAAFKTDTVQELLEVPIERLKKQLGDDTGSWLYSVVRGEDTSEVNPRTQIKSMLSAKSFRPSINSFEVGVRWLRIFVADIFSRLVEEGVLENKRRPKTVNLHHRQGAQTRSKQAPISMGKAVDEDMLFDLAKNLLAQAVADGRAWPCANLSLSVGGFEDGITGNKGISGFLVRGDEAKAMLSVPGESSDGGRTETPPLNKRRKVDDGRIGKFFATRHESTGGSEREHELDDEFYQLNETAAVEEEQDAFVPPPSAQRSPPSFDPAESSKAQKPPDTDQTTPANREDVPVILHPRVIDSYFCDRCQQSLPVASTGEHEDWHFAKDLQAHDRNTSAESVAARPLQPAPRSSMPHNKGRGRGRPPGQTVRAEKGQKRLAFG
ncbi:DNA-directed DNA polymerase eta rad30 [Elasticomyces elasticus]|nr:DNA-directed DNA polymerase eta rad30 [Elasticomyces elasticus]